MKCYGQQVIFWHLVMNDDDWWWMMVNTPRKKRMFVRWWGDVKKSLKRSSYNTKCRIFHHTRIYRIYKIYKIYNIFYRSFFYIHCNIYMFHDFCSLIAQNLASALWYAGFKPVQFFCTAPVGNLDKRNLASARFSGIGRRISRPHIATWGSDNALVGPTQIMTRW